MKGSTIKKASFQIGVDVLGFPIYIEHVITKGETKPCFNRKKEEWVTVQQKIIKQH